MYCRAVFLASDEALRHRSNLACKWRNGHDIERLKGYSRLVSGSENVDFGRGENETRHRPAVRSDAGKFREKIMSDTADRVKKIVVEHLAWTRTK